MRSFRGCNFFGIPCIVLLLMYKFLMDIQYIMHSSSVYYIYSYIGTDNYKNSEAAWWVYGIILLIFYPVLQRPFVVWRFSEYVLVMLLLLSVVPGLSMCGAGAFPETYVAYFCSYWVLFFLFAVTFSFLDIRCFNLAAIRIKVKEKYILYIGLFFSFFVVLVFIYGNVSFFCSSLYSQNVYDIRLAWSKVSLPTILKYVYTNTPIILSILLMHFLQRKRWLWSSWLLLSIYLQFSCAAQRVIIFWGMCAVGAYVMRKFLSMQRLLYFYLAILFLGMTPQGDTIVRPILYRISWETNSLGCCYFDYFSNHMSILCAFFNGEAIDKANIPFVIGALYRESPINHANTGLLGGAFMMAGGYGVILSPLLWNIYLYIMDRVGFRLVWWIKFGLSIGWAFEMMNVWLTTAMVSYGGIALGVMMWLCSASDSVRNILQKKTDIICSNNQEVDEKCMKI